MEKSSMIFFLFYLKIWLNFGKGFFVCYNYVFILYVGYIVVERFICICFMVME